MKIYTETGSRGKGAEGLLFLRKNGKRKRKIIIIELREESNTKRKVLLC